jgi:4-oxalocrotonate tautomerase
MPHINIKVVPGKSAEQKMKLTAVIVAEVIKAFETKDASVSVALEEIPKEEWTEKVYLPEIRDKWDKLLKKPGYNPLEK